MSKAHPLPKPKPRKRSKPTGRGRGRPKLAPVLDFTPLRSPTIGDYFSTLESMLRIISHALEIIQQRHVEIRKAIEAQRPGREAN